MVKARKLVPKPDLPPKATPLTGLAQTKGWFWEARNRILAWYGVLMVGFIGLSVPIFSYLVFSQLEARVANELAEEIDNFQKFVVKELPQSSQFSEEDLEQAFRRYLFRHIPEDDTFFITFVNGDFSRSSPRGRPDILQEDRELMVRWSKLTKKEKGEVVTKDPKLGNIIYLATPVFINERVNGVFAIAHTTAGEKREAEAVIWTVSQVLLVGLISALVLGWIASTRVLKPLRSLAATARSIGQLNLNERILIQGSGEIGELASTFNSMLERLQSAFNSQKAFLNNVGHELRTPIAIIRGHLELMGDDPQEQKETVEIVIDELDRMTRMVEELMLLAKSERPDFLKLETIDIEIFVSEIYSKGTALAHRDWKIDSKARGSFVGDRQRLTQALINLIENATQYTIESDTIAIGAMLDRSFVRLWVRDTGVGIAESDRQLIFERFARASNSRRNSSGCGLGLSIVQAIAQAHGGKVELFSKLGFGSTFSLIIPTESITENLAYRLKL